MKEFYLSKIEADKRDLGLGIEIENLSNGDDFSVRVSDGTLYFYRYENDGALFIKKENVSSLVYPIGLMVSVCEVSQMHFIYEFASQIGVKEIFPFVSDRGGILNYETEKKSLLDSIMKTSIECGRKVPPKVFEAKPIEEAYKKADYEKIYFPYELEKTKTFKDVLEKKPSLLIIGGNSGFSKREKDFILEEMKASTLSIGKAILRVDIASAYSLSVIRSVFDFS